MITPNSTCSTIVRLTLEIAGRQYIRLLEVNDDRLPNVVLTINGIELNVGCVFNPQDLLNFSDVFSANLDAVICWENDHSFAHDNVWCMSEDNWINKILVPKHLIKRAYGDVDLLCSFDHFQVLFSCPYMGFGIFSNLFPDTIYADYLSARNAVMLVTT